LPVSYASAGHTRITAPPPPTRHDEHRCARGHRRRRARCDLPV